MVQEITLTAQTRKVLSAVIDSPTVRLSGADIARETGLASGSLYPILSRLEKAGWVVSDWEAGDPSLLGRPRRRLYKITATGQRNAQQIVHELSPGGFSWA